MPNIKRITALLFTALVLSSFVLRAAADTRAGVAAYSDRDYATAYREFKPSAENGDPHAQFMLGRMYDVGLGVPPDDAKAAYWYRRAAEQGNAIAQRELGFMYAVGEGVPTDDKAAAYWYRKAADQGDPEAQLVLGMRYNEGAGVEEDHSIAAYWYRLAAVQGRVEAQFNLGLMYDQGDGVSQDYRQASKWWRMAADQGHDDAQLNLGVMYYNGQGVTQDYVQAHMWSNLASVKGGESARENRDKIAQRMTSAQIAEAQRLAREWKPTTYATAPSDLWSPAISSVVESAALPELVKQIQELLTNIGYQPGPADGVLGADTTAAIRAYQSANDLAVTGVVSDGLRDDLRELNSHYAEIEKAHPNVWKILDSGQLNEWIEQQPSDVATELQRIQESGTTEEVIAMLDRFKAETADPDRLELIASGSGFIVSENGDVLTNHHVVEDCREVRIAPSEVTFSMIGNDPENDLAVLRGAVPAEGIASFPTTGAALRGDSVVVAGFPLPGLLSSEMGITTGNVSALSGPGGDSRLMQITAPIQPGNSGGPVLDERGQVAGVVVAEIDSVLVANTIGYIPQNVNFAIKTDVARNFLDAYEVAYQTEPPGETLKTSVIAERAEDFTVAIGCWN